MDKQFRLRWTIKEQDTGTLVKDFIAKHKISKRALTDIKYKGGNILIDGNEVTVRELLKTEQILEIVFPMEDISESLIPENIPLNIIFEDSSLLIVKKPPFMNTIPSREHPTGSLANALMGHYEKIGLQTSPHIVTRLDRNTSGLVLIAKHRHIHHLFSESQKKGLVKREYEAFCEGYFQNDSGVIEEPIGRKEGSIIERTVIDSGQYAKTTYKVLRQFEHFAHVHLRLETGRTHQIRVHMSFLGHPLMGDDLYGGSLASIKRQALHCKSLKFIHPMNHEEYTFTSEIEKDMLAVIKKESL